MPLNGNTYVAPTWRNGGPPALDAAELQAISDSIVRNQGKNADQDTLIAALQTAVSGLQTGSAKIEVGSYVGTGAYGESSPNVVVLPFVPKFVFVAPTEKDSYFSLGFSGGFLWCTGMSGVNTNPNSNSAGIINGRNAVSLRGKTLSWYNLAGDAYHQMNVSGKSYSWMGTG